MSTTKHIFTADQIACLIRVIKRIGRQPPRPVNAFDVVNFSIFDEEPKRWSDAEVNAWKEFQKINLSDTGRISLPAVIEDTLKYVDSGKFLTLFFELRKGGFVDDLSKRTKETWKIK